MNIKSLLKATGNEDAFVAAESEDTTIFIDTGSYALNALLSGSIHGGLPNNRITCLAGEQATGKTFFALGICKNFLDSNPDSMVLYFDTENAINNDMVEGRGIDSSRLAIVPVLTIEEFKTQALKIVNAYLEEEKDKRKPILMVLDSLGMLSTEKEMNDTAEGKNVRDMTKAQLVKGAFRVLTAKLGKAEIPLLITNHTYQVVGAYVPTKDLSGGSGVKYAASTILFLSKKKDKTDDGVIGNFITCKNYKNRFAKENMEVETRLNYETGLNRYHGLADLAVEYGIFKSVSTRIELPDGSKVFMKNINEEPEKYFTDDILKQLDERIQKEFRYGKLDS
jgi:RecA/RadA recombinase